MFSLCTIFANVPHSRIENTVVSEVNVPSAGPRRQGPIPVGIGRRYPVASVSSERTACDTLLSGLSLTPSRGRGLLGHNLSRDSVHELNCGATPIINVARVTGRLRTRKLCLTKMPNFCQSSGNT